MMQFDGKVALVTGAARGLGKAVALGLARSGADVVIHYRSRREEASAVANEARAHGVRALILQADLQNIDEIRAMFADVQKHFGQLDILIGNAAQTLFKPTLMVSEHDLEAIINSNVRGTFILLQEAARMIADNGRIIHVSTAGTRHPMVAEGLFAGVRAAGDCFAMCLAHELGPRGVNVNVVSPGAMNTEGFLDVVSVSRELLEAITGSAELPNSDDGDPRANMSPLKRVAEPEDVADAIIAIVGPAGRWITAQNIFLTGGAISN